MPNTAFAQVAETGLDWSSPQGVIMREIYAWRRAELKRLGLVRPGRRA
ncbi:hypothetical protein [Streptomyces sp. 2A115]